ncbi:MAG: GEGP motif-containing diheme protein [Vulcanimicrobiota bacterium]
MKPVKSITLSLVIIAAAAVLIMISAQGGQSAYHHMGEKDSNIFLSVYPQCKGTKLDNCSLCHTGGAYKSKESTVNLGSCQWCHFKYGYTAPHGDIMDTLNPFGRQYLEAGRSEEAIRAMARMDSDSDGYVNVDEIAALAYPGDADDDPMKVAAPSRIYTIEQLEKMPQHAQLMLMNAHKSMDFYASYSGVSVEDLLRDIMLPSATGIKVFSPDGFSQYYPLKPDSNPLFYHVCGVYPEAPFYYDRQADGAISKDGWCEYSSLALKGKKAGEPIENPNGLRLLLAMKRDGQYLNSGILGPQNKLDGEGPFRVVPPQKTPCPPDQRQYAKDSKNKSLYIWPFDENADHNAGFSTRSAIIIKVEPLPSGTTDINTLEAGWNYVEGRQIIIYGAINPLPTIIEKLDRLTGLIEAQEQTLIKDSLQRKAVQEKIGAIKKSISLRHYSEAQRTLNDDLVKILEGNLSDSDEGKKFRLRAHEINVLLKTLICTHQHD